MPPACPSVTSAAESGSSLTPPLPEGRPPLPVRRGLWLFAPSRDSQGGSAWLLERPGLDLLIDCPGLTRANLEFLAERNRRRPEAAPRGWIVLLGRDGHGRCRRLQQAIGWPVLVQEQEAYLLPGVAPLSTFASEHRLDAATRLLWTPGPGPGSCVLHVRDEEADLDGLFCGRLLVPLGPDRLGPLRTPRCFHWPRQLRSLARLRQWLPSGSPEWIASGAGLGALRGAKLVHGGSGLLAGLELLVAAPTGSPYH